MRTDLKLFGEKMYRESHWVAVCHKKDRAYPLPMESEEELRKRIEELEKVLPKQNGVPIWRLRRLEIKPTLKSKEKKIKKRMVIFIGL